MGACYCRAMANEAPYVLSIDAGTTGITAMAFDLDLRPIGRSYAEFAQHFPNPGWVEHHAAEILAGLDDTMGAVLADLGRLPAAIGLTNQRETVFAVDGATGKALGPGIVWQDRRTSSRCRELREAGHEPMIRRKSGLMLDPYFSASKMEWMLGNVPAVQAAAEQRSLRFVTVDALLTHHLTGGARWVTDVTNASRTMLVDLSTPQAYDAELMELFGLEAWMLPEILPSAGHFGEALLSDGSAPITGVLGDQQAALFGQGCWEPGSLKNTYGTGCFLLLNTGAQRVTSKAGLLTTVAADRHGQPVFALEGSSFAGGTVIQWMRDQLGILRDAEESEALALSVEDTGGVVLVPAFAGLGSPHWDPDARAAIFGMTRGTGRAHVARAGLDAIAFQCMDLIDAMRADSETPILELLVDGGAAANKYLMQRQADLAGLTVRRPQNLDSTARGAAAIAAVGAGLLDDPGLAGAFQDERDVFTPAGSPAELAEDKERWQAAIQKVLTVRD
ncbi:MAG: glycerol kinase [Planctomycetota bacterium]